MVSSFIQAALEATDLYAVVTKAIVYAGIGIIATQLTPIAFEIVGVGLY